MKELNSKELVQVAGGFSLPGIIGGGALAFVSTAFASKFIGEAAIDLRLPNYVLPTQPEWVVVCAGIAGLVVGYNLSSSD